MWGEAARHVVWLMNRTTTKAVTNNTPFEATFGKKPDLSQVREWGDKVWVRIEGGDKLGGRVREGHWLGISDESKGVRIYWPDKKNVTTKRNVYFDKTSSSVSRLKGEEWKFVKTKPDEPLDEPKNPPNPLPPAEITPSIPNLDESASEDEEATPDLEITTKRIRKPTQKLQDIIEGRAVMSNLPSAPKFAAGIQLPTVVEAPGQVLEGEGQADWIMLMEDAMMTQTSEMEALEPPSLASARRSPDWLEWDKAIHTELDVLKEAETWEMVDAPAGANIVGSKWVFRAKKDAAGIVVRYKARLVAQGF